MLLLNSKPKLKLRSWMRIGKLCASLKLAKVQIKQISDRSAF
jgi:hypothetical protein